MICYVLRWMLLVVLAVLVQKNTCKTLPACKIGIDDVISELKVPEGLSIEPYICQAVVGARSLAVSQGDNDGAIITYVSTRSVQIYALIDEDADGRADRLEVLVDDSPGRDQYNGIVWHSKGGTSSLYVASVTKVFAYDDVDKRALKGEAFGKSEKRVIFDGFPNQRAHSWKYMALGPDQRLYVSVGADCNVCPPKKQISPKAPMPDQSIVSMKLDGSNVRLEAAGVRNSIGFAWHPATKELYFTSNGRDQMGNNLPDDGLFRVAKGKRGAFFGFPYCHVQGNGDPYKRALGPGKVFPDPDVNQNQKTLKCSDPSSHVQPIQALGPHVAALGMKFYTGSMLPAQYTNSIFIALRGSWNRDIPIGYQVSEVRVNPTKGTATLHRPFITRWLQLDNNRTLGRPVDIAILPDGSLLVSDDSTVLPNSRFWGGAVYRVVYTPNKPGQAKQLTAVKSPKATPASSGTSNQSVQGSDDQQGDNPQKVGLSEGAAPSDNKGRASAYGQGLTAGLVLVAIVVAMGW